MEGDSEKEEGRSWNYLGMNTLQPENKKISFMPRLSLAMYFLKLQTTIVLLNWK